jgi:hypothetical protein
VSGGLAAGPGLHDAFVGDLHAAVVVERDRCLLERLVGGEAILASMPGDTETIDEVLDRAVITDGGQDFPSYQSFVSPGLRSTSGFGSEFSSP